MVTTLSTSCNCRSQTWLVCIFCGRYILSITNLIQFSPSLKCVYIIWHPLYTGCHRRNGRNFGRVFLTLNYTDNPKHICPKLNGFGDNGQRILKIWQLLHTYWLQNSYWNWQEYVVSVMLVFVLNIKVTCEWHKAINLNCKVPRTRVIIHRVRSTIHHTGMMSGDVTRLLWLPAWHMQGYAFQASVSN